MTKRNLIPRTCTEVATDDSVLASLEGPQPLSAFRDVPAYVLLGEPGAGKTTEFERECEALGDQAERISARRFAKADIAAHREWRDNVLFIDGLDETRAGGRQATEALDEIAERLEQLGSPRFRLSCRAADWLGPVDRSPLAKISSDGRVVVLRLDPLNRFDVREYLTGQLPITDPANFIFEAESRGLGSLLDNPLTLQLLITATNSDGWPSTRRETFEGFCRRLAQELSSTHPSSAQAHPPEPILAAAGRLCAIQLLTGAEGFMLAPTATNSEFIPVAEVSADIAKALTLTDFEILDVFATSLFAPVGEQSYSPKHRQITEYLAAAHISHLVETGNISEGRVLTALTSRIDGSVVTDLRGLAAWLATLCSEARRELIASDPVGMGLYGDVSGWSIDDRVALLNSLIAQAKPEDLWGVRWFDKTKHRYRDATAWGFRNLCKPEMADVLEEYLRPPLLDAVPGHILELLLRSLAEIEDGWRDHLYKLVLHVRQLALGTTTHPEVRLAALLAFARIEPSPSEKQATLRDALEAVRESRFADPDDEIAGSLLRILYPHAIGPDRIWEYASLLHRGPSAKNRDFWRYVLCDETPADELPNLLDNFADDAERLWPVLAGAFAEEGLRKLLVRTLREIGHQTDPERLYRWIAAVTSQGPTTTRDENAELREWLGDNDAITQQLLRIEIARSTGDEASFHERHVLRELWLATHLPDFVEWCAQQARAQVEIDWDMACAFLEAPLRHGYWLETSGDLIQRLRSALANDSELLGHLNEHLVPSKTQPEDHEVVRRLRQQTNKKLAEYEQKRLQRQSEWRVLIQASDKELASPSFPAQNLHTLALAYFGLLIPVTDLSDPRERLMELIGDHTELIDAVIGALRDAPLRADLPTVERTTELITDSKHDWLAFPVLAGLAIRESEKSLDDRPLSDDIRRKALAIYSGVALMPSDKPAWPKRWLRADPTLVLDVLHRCSIAAVKRGDTHLSMLNWLDEVDDLDDEIRDFRLGLLRSVSVRLPVAQLPLADDLLLLVSRHPDTAPLKKLVTQKLRSKSMTDAQRVRWMTLDAIMNGGEALGLLDDFIGSNAKRANQLAEFLRAEHYPSNAFIGRLFSDDSCATLHTLIGIVGRHFRPREIKSGKAVWIGPAERMSDLVYQWINDLGGKPTEEAGVALNALIADERLSAWHNKMAYFRNRQRRLHRDASYAPLDVSDILGLLRNGPPANVADLAVLLDERLRDIGSYIRGDNSDPWRQFWADDQNTQPKRPKHEDSCRDALLGMLRNRLPTGVDAEPEGHYAADCRVDIRVASKDFNIPIEIKKNSHAELWTAIQDQLIDKYTTGRNTGDYGIYVVLWFGSEASGYPRHPTDHDRPKTPEELAHRLNESLSHEQRRTISVVVLDVTKP